MQLFGKVTEYNLNLGFVMYTKINLLIINQFFKEKLRMENRVISFSSARYKRVGDC